MTVHLPDFEFEMPTGGLTFAGFREWTLSQSFPERGRFDFLQWRVEADMSPESLFSHNQPKSKILSVLYATVKQRNLGIVFGDRARVVVESVGLSCEPDLTFVSNESFDSGRVKLTPKEERPSDSIEIVGPPDLVVELVSDSSVAKDTQDLFRLYYEADVREYWLIDARGDEMSFRLLVRGPSDWQDVAPDADGFFASPVLGQRYRLGRAAGRRGEWRYDLVEVANP